MMTLTKASAELRKEYQIKVRDTIDVSLLLSLGGELLGRATQKDIYLAGPDTWRIREEAGRTIFAQKSHDVGRFARVKDVSERFIDKAEASHIMRERGVRVTIFKDRTLFRLGDAVVTLDEIEYLGSFVEIRSGSETELRRTLRLLGLKEKDAVRESYLDLMIRRSLPRWLQTLLRLHERVGELAFGVTSGILTTIGVLVGVNSATASRISIIAAVAAVAIADSASDAFGMYVSKVSQRGIPRSEAMRYALWTFAGKFIIPLTFIVPLLVADLSSAVWTDLGWAMVLMSLVAAERAIVVQSSLPKEIARTVGLAAIVIFFARLVGMMIAAVIR